MRLESLVAIPYILWLGLLPYGLFVAARGLRQERWRLAVGIMLAALSLPAFWGLSIWEPWDFLGPSRDRVLMTVTTSGYRIDLIQRPGGDTLYGSWVRVTDPDGRSDEWLVEYETERWWHPRWQQVGTRTYLLRGHASIDKDSIYVDVTEGVLYTNECDPPYSIRKPSGDASRETQE